MREVHNIPSWRVPRARETTPRALLMMMMTSLVHEGKALCFFRVMARLFLSFPANFSLGNRRSDRPPRRCHPVAQRIPLTSSSWTFPMGKKKKKRNHTQRAKDFKYRSSSARAQIDIMRLFRWKDLKERELCAALPHPKLLGYSTKAQSFWWIIPLPTFHGFFILLFPLLLLLPSRLLAQKKNEA